MLRPRVIPCLLLSQGSLVKTVRFKNPTYIGDPINAVRIFNEKNVDELMILDIGATKSGFSINNQLITLLAGECRMPLCYGGGIVSIEQIECLISLGVEKVALSASLYTNPQLVVNAVQQFGSQSIVAVIDYISGPNIGQSQCVYNRGSIKTRINPITFASQLAEWGVGEIVINCVDRDGTMTGYDIELAAEVRAKVSLPITILGGAGSYKDLCHAVSRISAVGVAAGSLFVFKGKYRAVMLSYLSHEERLNLASLSHVGH